MARTAEEELDAFIKELDKKSRFYAYLKWASLIFSITLRSAILFLPVVASVLAALSTENTYEKFKIYLIVMPIVVAGAASFLALARYDTFVPLLEEYQQGFEYLAYRYRQKRHTGESIAIMHGQALEEYRALESSFFPKFRDQLVQLMSVRENPSDSATSGNQ